VTGAVTLISALTVLALAAACDGHDDGASQWSSTVAGLCTAAEQAAAGDAGDARRTFLDESHDALHRLADEVTELDRALATGLLEAKERVEAGLEAGSPSLPADLDGLVDATRAAVRITDDPVPSACSQ